MPRAVPAWLQALATFPPHGSWEELGDLLAERWEHGPSREAQVPLFRFLARFPTDERGGVWMGLVHGVETLRAYESELLGSLHRQPTEMTLLLLRRLANTGLSTVAQVPVADGYGPDRAVQGAGGGRRVPLRVAGQNGAAGAHQQDPQSLRRTERELCHGPMIHPPC
ncbi:hypothetical protein SAMN04515668_4440 [Hymenobacter arizonensis]|uniref:Uncharacterized protein n=1 Tax=Hymenobacter arizonensis TaxID=1227077 RepID=A0A1I6BEW5_HYMAR|nr:hypothetical protein SAMN04515668_4440 [Hymenobacter arizonensis]